MSTAKSHRAEPSPVQWGRSIPLKQIDESPTNPREDFDKEALAELAASIKQQGVLQPVMVRSLDGDSRYELVFGHRRFRAAKLAGLKEIPVIIRDLGEQEVLEAQLCENLKRSDLSAVEEADGYSRLKEEFNLTVEQIARKVGKSKASVYARMKLTELSTGARKLIHDKRVDASIALLAARMPTGKMQEQFLKDATTPERGDLQPWSYRDAARHARADYMVDLDEAQFDTKDPDLLAQKSPDELFPGPCRACPMRTGNQADLFTDVKDGNVCTSPKCFRAKQDAHWSRVKASAKREGVRILEGADAKKLFGGADQGYGVDGRSGYIDLHNVSHANGKRYSELLKGKAVEGRCLAQDARGFIHELMTPADLHAALKEIGYKRLADEDLVAEEPEEKPAPKKAEPAGKPSACYLCDKVIPRGADDCTLDGTGWAHDKCLEAEDAKQESAALDRALKPKKKPPTEEPAEAKADSLRAPIDPNGMPFLGVYVLVCPSCNADARLSEEPAGAVLRKWIGACEGCGRTFRLAVERDEPEKATKPAPADKVWTKTYRDRKPKAEPAQQFTSGIVYDPPAKLPMIEADNAREVLRASDEQGGRRPFLCSKCLRLSADGLAHFDGEQPCNGGRQQQLSEAQFDEIKTMVGWKPGAAYPKAQAADQVPDHCSVCGGKKDLRFCKPPGFMYCDPCRVKAGVGFEDDYQRPASEVLSEVRRENKAKHRDDAKPGPIIDVQPDESDSVAEERHKAKRATK